ncbi:hypothetical protein EJA72_12775 [Pseudomonas sp. PB120]|nr:hypothetical protein [Pseudomonas sp. PB120]
MARSLTNLGDKRTVRGRTIRSTTFSCRVYIFNLLPQTPVARELAPARLRSSRKPKHSVYLRYRGGLLGAAAQPSGSKLPRHKGIAKPRKRQRPPEGGLCLVKRQLSTRLT